MVSLLFGCAYLLLGARRDRVEDTRAGTAFYAVAAPILVIGLAWLSSDLKTIGTSLVALALGGCALWLGTRTGRRFTSWAGTAACVFAVLNLVDEAVGESARASAAVLVAIGLALAIGVAAVERRRDDDPADLAADPDGGPDGGSLDPLDPPTSGTGAAPDVDPYAPPGPGAAF